LYEIEAKKRQVRTAENRNLVVEKIPQQESKTKTRDANKSREKAAKKLNTNSHYVSDAKKLQTGYPVSLRIRKLNGMPRYSISGWLAIRRKPLPMQLVVIRQV
jgi:hypothetical protein